MMAKLAQPLPRKLVDKFDSRFFASIFRSRRCSFPVFQAGAFFAYRLITKLLMCAIAERCISCVFALAKVRVTILFGDKALGLESRTRV